MAKSEKVETQKESLFSLVAQANQVTHLLAETGGEITPELEAMMTKVDVGIPAKIDAYKVVMERLEAESEYWKLKASQYSSMARSLQALSDKLNDSIKGAMKAMNLTEIAGNDYRFKLAAVKPSLKLDVDKLDKTYLTVVQTTVPDKERIRAALQEGAEITGASLETSVSLRSYLNKKEK